MKCQIKNFLQGERDYSVEGHIRFKFVSADVVPDLEALRRAILEVDKLHPWHDDIPDSWGASEFQSIRYLTDVRDVRPRVNNWSVPEKDCDFMVKPEFESMRRSQVYAYEKYLAKLAEELAKVGLPDVVEVTSLIQVWSATHFKV